MLKGVKPPHIVVGTPGRIKHLVTRKDLDLSNLKIFVLDECDKMLEETGMKLSNNNHNHYQNNLKMLMLPLYRHEI